jgi:hypothetical protein
VAINPKKKIAIALLVNSPSVLANQGVPQFFKMYEHYADPIRKWEMSPLDLTQSREAAKKLN